MITQHTPETLRAFEAQVAEEFNRGAIRAPIHLDGGNEAPLLDYFARAFRPGDWVCCSWRSHYKALLAGVPPEEVHAAIMAGRSIALCFPTHRVISSAIVGGIVPIAVGLAMGIKRKHGFSSRPMPSVHCFVGDMTAMTGGYLECRRYAQGHDLLIHFIVEDNGKSVMTPTQEVWGSVGRALGAEARDVAAKASLETRFCYDLPWPHSGAGVRVNF